MGKLIFLMLVTAGVSFAVETQRPRTSSSGSSGYPDCTGLIGFSGKGLGRVYNTGLVGYQKKIVNPGGGFSHETGEYTVSCPGFYMVSFSSYPQTPTIMYRLTLKKLSAKSSGWEDIISTGPNGGSNQIILQLEGNDQIGVFYSGKPRESADSSTFSGYRLTQK